MVRYDRETARRGKKYVQDRRDARRARSGGGRRGGGVAVGGGGALLIALLAAFCGVPALTGDGSGFGLDTQTPFDGSAQGFDDVAGPATTTVDPDADTVEFMEFLMFDIQDTWDAYFEEAGQLYEPTTLVIFEDVVNTGCGQATSAVGPFYCPAPGDNMVYIDLGFYNELSRRFGAPGDFAQAYVIAHEVGHHIQSITGISDAVRQAQAQDPGNRNEYSIRQELQADCLAGVWAFSANRRLTEVSGQPIIEPGDINEGLAAAAAVGDDRIQSSAGARVNPETWTHGSSEQRQRWFLTGFETGDPEQCDPFAVDNP
ncbi:MAG: neutral zinc metallopeptidase [Actinomycetota bacterium]